MSGQPESEQLQNFNQRLSQWVSSQGFWFQLRYSLAAGGGGGGMSFHMLKLAARLGVFLLIIAVGAWFFLLKRTGTEGYHEGLTQSLKGIFAAEEIEMHGFSIQKGEFYISRVAMLGGDQTFFTGMELRNVKARKGLLDNFRQQWDPGLVEISRASVDLRAGADSRESAAAIARVLLQNPAEVRFDALQVADMSLRWGYSARTRGSINGSRMRAQRVPDGWRLRFTGGTFTQNWLKRLEIVELVVGFRSEGMVFEKAVFKKGRGEVVFENLTVKGGERPAVSGTAKLSNVDLSQLVPAAVRNFVEGNLSGELDVFGSTNSSEGIGFEGKVEIEGDSLVVIRDRLHLLRALSVVDAFNNYRRLDFRAGSFHMKTHGGGLEVRDVDLKAGELVTLSGAMKVRLPTFEESQSFSGFNADGAEAGILSAEELEGKGDLTLNRVAAAGASAEAGGAEGSSVFEKLGVIAESRQLDEQADERISRELRYEGSFTMALPKEAFTRAPQLAELYPSEGPNGRVVVEVPLSGVLYELTMKQSEEIYEKGTR